MSATLEIPPPSQAAPRSQPQVVWLSTEAVVFAVVWLVLLVAGRERLFQDPGTFWHTAVGEQMLSTRELVRTDSFTFTFGGEPWIAHQWLGECLMAAAYRLGGWDALLLGTATLLAALFSWIAHRWLRAGHHPALIAVVLAIVFGASAHHYHVRPHLASIVLLAACFGILCDVESRRAELTRLFWLVPLVALWTNLHGGTLGGLATVGIVLVGWTVAWGVRLPSPLRTWRDVCFALSMLIACTAVLLVNPYGAQMPQAWLTIMKLSLPDVIQEHGRLDFMRAEAWMVLLLGGAYAWTIWRTRSWRVTWLIPLVWLCLACDRVRHAPLFAVVAAIGLAEILPRAASLSSDSRRRSVAPCIGMVVIALMSQAAGAGWAKLDPRLWPVEMLAELRQLERESPEARVFNSLHYGGFLAFHTPGLRSFIDDRCELFGDAFLREYARAERSAPQQIDLWQREFDFRHALVQASSPLDLYLSTHSRWQLVHRTSAAALYQFAK